MTSKKLTAEEKLQMAFADNLIAQTELLEAITKLENIMAKIFNGNESLGDPAIEEGDLERDLENETMLEEELRKADDLKNEAVEQTEPDEKDIEELEESGLLPDDDEDAGLEK